MPAWPVPGGYRLARLLMGDTSRLTDEEQLFMTRLLGGGGGTREPDATSHPSYQRMPVIETHARRAGHHDAS